MDRFAAGSAASLAAASAKRMRGFWDYRIAGQGMPAQILQLEALYAVAPDNETLALLLASTYVGYAFGWLEVEMERASDAGRFDEADRLRERCRLLYTRARNVALAAMRRRDPGIDEALQGKPSALRRYLRVHYDDPEDDVAPLFWTATAWGAILNVSDDMEAVAALPSIVAMVEHSVTLDAAFEDAGGLVFLGGFHAQYPAQFGGSPEKASQYFKRALKLTERRALLVHYNYARLYALTMHDEPLLRSLLDEVMDKRDRGSDVRLSNKIARVRARLLLSKVDQ